MNIKQPQIGAKVLVWDEDYNEWVLAYWTRDKTFEEWHGGKRRIILGRLWKDLPSKPTLGVKDDLLFDIPLNPKQ